MYSRSVLALFLLALKLVFSQGQVVIVTVDPSVDNSDCLSAQQLRSTGRVESTCRTVNDALGNVTCQSSCGIIDLADRIEDALIRLVDGVHHLSGEYYGCSQVVDF